jgi:hypothetical protein
VFGDGDRAADTSVAADAADIVDGDDDDEFDADAEENP